MSSQIVTPAAAPDVVYPDSDGEPMGETGWHVNVLLYLYAALREHFAGRQDVYVAADMFLYYKEGDPGYVKAPDCMVIFGVPNHTRRSFKTWIEGAVPAVIFEITSESTFRNDFGEKMEVYAGLGVREYYVFDPLGTCFDRSFFGHQLRDGRYEPMPLEADGGLTSPALGLRLVPEGELLRLIDAATGLPLPTIPEAIEQLQAERQRAEQEQQRAVLERQRAEDLAAEVQRLRALLGERDTGRANHKIDE